MSDGLVVASRGENAFMVWKSPVSATIVVNCLSCSNWFMVVYLIGKDQLAFYVNPAALSSFRQRRANGIQCFQVSAERMVEVGLAMWRFFGAVTGIVALQDPVPAATLLVDQVLHAVLPQLIINFPVNRNAGALRQQRGSRQRLSLHPEIFVAVAHAHVGRDTIEQSAMLLIPGHRNGGVEQGLRARRQPTGIVLQMFGMALQDQQQLGPFGHVAGLIAPGPEHVGVVVAVVVPVDTPISVIMLPDPAISQRCLAYRDVARQLFSALQIARLAAGFEGCQQGFATMHVGILATIGRYFAGRCCFICIQAVLLRPEQLFHQCERGSDKRPRSEE